MIDKVYGTAKNYYAQVLLEECKYAVWKKKLEDITDNMEIYSDDSDEENCDKESKVCNVFFYSWCRKFYHSYILWKKLLCLKNPIWV